MRSEGSVTHWIGELQAGHRDAAQKLWERYYRRLVGLARKELGTSPQGMADEEDVVQSAFQSFCSAAEAGRFPSLNDRDDLWKLLVAMTARKAVNQRKRELRQKRGGGRVRGDSAFRNPALADSLAGVEQIVGDEPTPEFAAEVTEQLEQLIGVLDDATLRLIAFWKLEGFNNEEMARNLDCSLRSIERKLDLIRKCWTQERAP